MCGRCSMGSGCFECPIRESQQWLPRFLPYHTDLPERDPPPPAGAECLEKGLSGSESGREILGAVPASQPLGDLVFRLPHGVGVVEADVGEDNDLRPQQPVRLDAVIFRMNAHDLGDETLSARIRRLLDELLLLDN